MKCCKCKCLIALIRRIISETPAQSIGLSGTQMQLTGSPGGIIANASPVIFDTPILTNPNISYLAGNFTILKSGTYEIDWQVATDGTDGSPTIDFSVTVNGSNYATMSTPIVSGLLSGSAIINATQGDIVSLVNSSGGIVQYGVTAVQANITILGVA